MVVITRNHFDTLGCTIRNFEYDNSCTPFCVSISVKVDNMISARKLRDSVVSFSNFILLLTAYFLGVLISFVLFKLFNKQRQIGNTYWKESEELKSVFFQY